MDYVGEIDLVIHTLYKSDKSFDKLDDVRRRN